MAASADTLITNDIWYHVADYIAPEAVGTFALICQQTAALVRTKKFWSKLYQRYCGSTKHWVIGLPPRLQLESTKSCDLRALRCLVIEALYICHEPFKLRVELGYKMDMLIGRIYAASWHIKCHCVWVMCYKFCQQPLSPRRRKGVRHFDALLEEPPVPVVNDWEMLLDHGAENIDSMRVNDVIASPQEGSTLLIICSGRYIPFPTEILYAEGSVRLMATRDMLSTDMRGSNLELDFGDGTRVIKTVKYPKILRHKVLPWWHPDFRKFFK